MVPIAPKSAAITHVVPSITYTGPYPTEPLTDATASPFQVGVTLHTWAPQPTTATLAVAGSWGEGGFTSGTISVPAGDGKISTVLTAKGVKLWWPNGFGEQPLYNLTASLTFAFGDKTDSDSAPLRIGSAEHGESDQTGESARGSTEVVAGVSGRGETAVASSTRRVGFRYLVLVTGNDTDPAYVAAAATQDGSAPKGGVTTFIFRVNGAPVFAKGEGKCVCAMCCCVCATSVTSDCVLIGCLCRRESCANGGAGRSGLWGGHAVPCQERRRRR